MNRRLTIAVVVLLAILAPPVLTWMTEPLEVRAARWPAQAVTPTVEDCLILEKRAGLWSARPCEAMPTATPTPTETPTPTLTSTPTVTPSAMTVTPLSPTPTATVTPTPNTWILVKNARDFSIRLRSACTTAAGHLTWVAPGKSFEINTARSVRADGYLWYEAIVDYLNTPSVGTSFGGCLAVAQIVGSGLDWWIYPTPIAAMTPTPEAGLPSRSKLGVHLVIGNWNGLGEFWGRLSAENAPIHALAVDAGGVLSEADALGGDTYYRYNGAGDGPGGAYVGDPITAARAFYDLQWPAWDANPADWYLWTNEFDPPNAASWWWWDEFSTEAVRLAWDDHRCLVMWNYATGTPELAELDYLAGTLALMSAHNVESGFPCYVYGMHEYSLTADYRAAFPYLIGRYRSVCEWLWDHNYAVNVAITEVSLNGGHDWGGSALFLDFARWLDGVYREPPWSGCLEVAALFSLGNWANANYYEALPGLGEIIAG